MDQSDVSVSDASASSVSVTTPGDICAPKGFLAAGIHCGIKPEKLDLALVYSEEVETTAAAVFTTNQVRAAPVRLDEEVAARGRARAIVVNSGNANACTGAQGMEDAREMARLTAEALSLDPEEIFVASTGIIGVPMRMDPLRTGIPDVASRLGHEGDDAARAILTTDSFPKTAKASVEIDGTVVTVGAMAKGAGMIHPQMATTLGFLTTDARIEAGLLREALRRAVDVSFNRITVDGAMSTNDTVFLLANGAAGGPAVERGPALDRFVELLSEVSTAVARMVPRDGEGARKLVEVRIEGAATVEDAARCARTVANSLLVKTAIRGEDANWGRVISAVGSAGVELEEGRIRMWVGDVQLVEGGMGIPGSVSRGREVLGDDTVLLRVDLGLGDESATIWTCDLGEEYIAINVQYN